MDNIKIKKHTDYSKLIEENKHYIIITAIYILGLIAGTLIYKNLDTDALNKTLEKILISNDNTFLSIFVQKIITYLCVYILAVVFALSVIGYPAVNIIPFLCGFEIAVKLSYYYTLYNIKGLGYSLLLNAPEISAFMLIIIFTVNQAGELSKKIFRSTFMKESGEINNASYYLKKFCVYVLGIICVATVNSLVEYLLSSIITL